jgi:hypothetical protein
MCRTASPGEEMGLMGVFNSSTFANILGRDLSNFQRLFRKKAMLHHYTEYVEEAVVREAEQDVMELIADYQAIEEGRYPVTSAIEDLPPNFPLFPSF